jgi:hypothetical protein
VIVLLSVALSACQTAPRQKPLTELTEAEQIELYKYSPADKPAEPGYDWDNIYRDTALVILAIPLFVVYCAAQSNYHFSVKK